MQKIKWKSLHLTVVIFSCIAMNQTVQAEQIRGEKAQRCACQGVLSATQIADLFWAELVIEPNSSNQKKIVSKYLPLLKLNTTKMPSNRLERLALGETAFLSFQPRLAADYFESLIEGNDLVSRHAWARLMQVRYRAFDQHELAEMMVKEFYVKFPPDIREIHGRSQQIGNISSTLIKNGEPAQAAKLISDELKLLTPVAPFTSFTLIDRHGDIIANSNQNNEIRRSVASKLDELKQLDAKWTMEKIDALGERKTFNQMPQWYWHAQGALPGETFNMTRHRQLKKSINLLTQLLNANLES